MHACYLGALYRLGVVKVDIKTLLLLVANAANGVKDFQVFYYVLSKAIEMLDSESIREIGDFHARIMRDVCQNQTEEVDYQSCLSWYQVSLPPVFLEQTTLR